MKTSGLAGALALAFAGTILGGVVGALPAAAQQQRQPTFKSPEAAYEHGLSALRSGYVEHAIPALRFAADHDVFLAQYYLARILSDNGTPYTDHVAAYQLYRKIVVDNTNMDPDDGLRRPFVARALTALAGYVRRGLGAADLRADPARSAEYLRHAAQFFNDEEAQFELAKMSLDGEGVPRDVRTGMHWISTLAQRGHAAAQAYLADILWRGRYGIGRDQLRAFTLISVAVENAPESERVWIEDIYQAIFCGSGSGTRNQAQAMVADWRQKYGRALSQGYRSSLGALPVTAERTCRNGEPVTPPAPRSQAPSPRPRPDLGDVRDAGMIRPGSRQ